MEISLGLIQKKEKYTGLELALSNKTKESRGVQVGGLNIAE